MQWAYDLLKTRGIALGEKREAELWALWILALGRCEKRWGVLKWVAEYWGGGEMGQSQETQEIIAVFQEAIKGDWADGRRIWRAHSRPSSALSQAEIDHDPPAKIGRPPGDRRPADDR